MDYFTVILYYMYTVGHNKRTPSFFVYKFHCKQQNFMKSQQEAYQDMLHHTQHKFHTVESQF